MNTFLKWMEQFISPSHYFTNCTLEEIAVLWSAPMKGILVK